MAGIAATSRAGSMAGIVIGIGSVVVAARVARARGGSFIADPSVPLVAHQLTTARAAIPPPGAALTVTAPGPAAGARGAAGLPAIIPVV